MERRTALRQLAFLTGGALLLPACSRTVKQASMELQHLKISADQEELLGEIVGTLLPATDTPGAKELDVHHFVLRMIDACTTPEQQKDFSAGLADFENVAEEKLGTSFLRANKDERLRFLKALDQVKASDGNEAEKKKPLNTFYAMTKDLAVRGYMTSEYVMTNLGYYTLVPGKFQGCVEVKNPNDYKTIQG